MISKTPQQFYFHPNPMLLTLITNYKKNMFKVNEIDPNIFWVKQKDISEENKIHSFLWLNLIDRKNDSKLLQRIISAWMVKNTNYKKNMGKFFIEQKND